MILIPAFQHSTSEVEACDTIVCMYAVPAHLFVPNCYVKGSLCTVGILCILFTV
jgi:hypothetical protein